MKKNQERRLHRKNAKIVKEGGTPMTLHRPVKPDTTRRCGHCGQMGHMSTFFLVPFRMNARTKQNKTCAETNRKCPRWAEFNSGAAPLPSSTPAATPSALPGNLGFNRGPGTPAFAPSPLATSPPMMSMADEVPSTPTPVAAPKIKLTLKRNP